MIGSRTAAAVRDGLRVLELDRLQVKGKTEPETIYTVLGRLDIAGEDFAASPSSTTRCWRRIASGAGRIAWRPSSCAASSGGAGLEAFYKHYVDRVRALIEAPPEAELGWGLGRGAEIALPASCYG